MNRVNVMAARKAFSETINRVAFGKERIVLERRGKDVAALVSVEDLKLFEKLLDELEDRLDVEEIRRREADESDEVRDYDVVRRELGFK
jgi:prevent-host-death family protein